MNKMKSFRIVLLLLFLTVATSMSAQMVKGTVKDSNGEPVIGATVMEEGTKNGVVTDLDGNFTIGLSKSKSIVVSYIGMTTQTVNVAGKKTVEVILKEDAQTMEDVVVIGYGTVQKRDLTGAVASVTAEDIELAPVNSAAEALKGRLSGVNVTSTDGSPDAEIKIRVRGGGSLSQDNSPLYVVDGFQVESISDISPAEIKSIDILKDASSTAIYGSQGANGVVIITTKRGREGKVQVNLNASHGWKKVAKLEEMLSPYEYAYLQYEIKGDKSGYGRWDDLDIWKSVSGHDYQDEMFGRTGQQNQYNLNISGGNKALKYNLTYAHDDQKAVMINSKYRQDNFNVKLNATINQWLSLDYQTRMSYNVFNGLRSGSDITDNTASNSLMRYVSNQAPIERIEAIEDAEDEEYDESGEIILQTDPISRIRGTFSESRRLQLSNNVGLNWTPIQHLTFRSQFSYTWRYNDTEDVRDRNANYKNSRLGYSAKPLAITVDDRNLGWRNSNTLTYEDKKFHGGRDRINIMVGQEWSSGYSKSHTTTTVAFPAELSIDEIRANLSAGTPLPTASNIGTKTNMLSFFGRANYTLADKYLATVTFRADGSSKFTDGNRWGFFPSAALAWRISEEKFMQKYTWLDNLKLRVSLGTAGNNRIPTSSVATYFTMTNSTGKTPFFDETRTSMLQNGNTLYNSDTKWETTITRNLGVDFGLWRGRLNGTLELYWNTTKDLLMRVDVPYTSGYRYQYQNFGQTSNKGIELNLNGVIIHRKDLDLTGNFNIAWNRAHIDKLNTRANGYINYNVGNSLFFDSDIFMLKEGGRLGEVYGYKTNGFYTVYDPELNPNGDLVLVRNTNGYEWQLREGHAKDNSTSLTGGTLYPGGQKYQVDENGDPVKQRLGNTLPAVVGGFGLDLRWKNLDFSVFCNYSLGNKTINGTYASNLSNLGGSGKNLVNDVRLGRRVTWVDPETGMNLVKPGSWAEVMAVYETPENVMARMAAINSNASTISPLGMSRIVITDDILEDASFLRVQNITMGYTLPKAWLAKLSVGIQRVRFYATGYNLFCFTGYSGYDPEIDTSGNSMCPGVEYAAYPKSRSYVVGVNVTF